MDLNKIFKKINFVAKYRKICSNYNDFDNRFKGSNKKLIQEILKEIDEDFFFIAKDRLFKLDFNLKKSQINLGLSISNGLIEPQLFFIENDEWIIYNRFDFISEELSPGFREEFNIPKYTSEAELKSILKDIYSIYQDIKNEFVREF